MTFKGNGFTWQLNAPHPVPEYVNAVEGTEQHFVSQGKGQRSIMYFLVNAHPPKPLDVTASNFAGA